MNNYKITLLKGDGIGPEIVNQAVKVLDKAASKFDFTVTYDEALLGGCAIDATGVPLPEETIAKCKASDSVMLGAVGGPKWDNQPGNNRPEAGLLGIRGALGLFANLRPSVIFGPLKSASPIKDDIIGDNMDIMIVRELTGGIYFGERGRKEVDGQPAAWDTEQYSVPEIERIARVAFDLAMKRDKKVTCAMQLVRNPKQFDVIVTSNIFGDILSDEASMIAGSIGMLASASLSGGKLGLYEPIHGSAPDIAGQDIANPLATILSVSMMLRYSLGQPEAAAAIEEAVAKVLENYRTPDIYEEGKKKVGCEEMGDLVCAQL